MKRLVSSLLCVAVVTIALVAAANAAVPRVNHACGDLPANSKHNTISNISARNVSCRIARRVTLRAFYHCVTTCVVHGGWHCRVRTSGEASSYTCKRHRGRQVVRFETGV